MVRARRNCNGTGRDSADLRWCVSVCSSAITQLAVSVVTPTLHCTIGSQGTCEFVTCSDRSDTRREAKNVDSGDAICIGAIAKLPTTVISAPTLHAAV